MRAHTWLLAAILGACGSAPRGSALRVEITWTPEVTSPCFRLRVWGEGHSATSQPAVRGEKSSLLVGMFQVELPREVTLQAVGFADEACTVESVPAEVSVRTTARFGDGVSAVTLLVERAAVTTPDAGTGDSGVDASVDAGPEDAGVDDSGVDAGGADAGTMDAGADGGVDAGTPERCDNRMDDDGDALVDCADPDCTTGTACDDGDLCSVGETCGGGACGGGTFTCVGPVVACYALSGCDAGVCLGSPQPAQTPCDGGRCDGAGRCAPFCDPLNAGLRACYQFEGVLTDGSGRGNHGTTDAGSFVAGSRGQAYRSGARGVRAGDSATLECTTALTMEAWVLLSAWPDAGARYGVLDNNGQYGLFIGPGGELRCSAGVASSVPGAVGLGAWHHLGCVFDGPALTMRSYVDGVEVALNAAGLPDGGVRVLSVGDDAGLTLGEQSPSGDVLNGAIDGVRIWCVPRTAAELCATLGQCG